MGDATKISESVTAWAVPDTQLTILKPTPFDVPHHIKNSPCLERAIQKIPEAHLPVDAIRRERILDDSVDCRFILLAFRKGLNEQEMAVGRIWHPVRKMEISFTGGEPFNNIRFVAPLPGLAHLSAEGMDRLIINALGNEARDFGGDGDGDGLQGPQHLTVDARAAIRTLPRKVVNHTRYLYRLAALWWAAVQAEAGKQRLYYRGSEAARSYPALTINSIAGLCDLLERGYRSSENIVYFEHTRMGYWSGSDELSWILRVACDPKPRWQVDGELEVGITAVWPEIHDLTFASLQVRPLPNLIPGVVASTNVWDAAVHYSSQHDVADEFTEAVYSTGGFAFRPEGGKGGLLGAEVVWPLPEAGMQSLALGPIMAEIRSPTATAKSPDEPEYYDMAWDAVVRSMMWELSTSSCLSLGGLRDALLDNAPTELCRTLICKLVAQRGAPPYSHAVAETAAILGFPDLLGRSLGRIAFKLKIDLLRAIWDYSSAAVQWEEALLFTNMISNSAAVYGQLKPVALATMDILGLWCHAGHIIGGECDQHGLYALATYGDVDIRACRRDLVSGITEFIPMPLTKNSYRGVPTDHLYGRLQYDHAVADPVFKINSGTTLIKAADGARSRAKWVWYADFYAH